MSPYNYCLNNPIVYHDDDGNQPKKIQTAIGSTGAIEYADKDGKATGIPISFGVPEVTITAQAKKPTFWQKAGAFLKGAAKGIVIAAAVVALIAFTGGLGLAGLAAVMTYTAIGIGVAATVKTGYELISGKEAFTGRKLGTLEKWGMAGELTGAFIGGARVSGGAGALGKRTLPLPEGTPEIKPVIPEGELLPKPVIPKDEILPLNSSPDELTPVNNEEISHKMRVVEENGETGETTISDPMEDLVGFRKDHILNRHRGGTGLPGKTEFPVSWSDERIIYEVNKIANDPNAPGGLGKWDSPYKTGTVDGIDIRVDFYPNGHPKYSGKVSTAYPTNTPANP